MLHIYKFQNHDYHVHVLINKMLLIMKDNIANNITVYGDFPPSLE